MPVPHASENFADLLDPRFQKIFNDTLKQIPDKIPMLYANPGTNGRDTMTFSNVGTVPDWSEFTGEVSYNSQSQGYDSTITPLEFVNGIQVKRKLFDDDQYHVMDQKPQGLATSAMRTRQKHGARVFTNAFSTDTFFQSHSEGVALCSNSHTTTSGASTAIGFDNLQTAALTAVAVAANRIQMVKFRGDQAEHISVMPDELWFPPDLYEVAEEINGSSGKLDTANNNDNIHQGKYSLNEWNYMTDTNNWFMCDSTGRKMNLFWTDRIGIEFAMVEDFDKLIAKWRGYGRWGAGRNDWRWILGNQVS